MAADKPCPWCKLSEPSMAAQCLCHPRDCGCAPCANGRYWRWLEAGPDEWTSSPPPAPPNTEQGRG